MTTSMIPVRRVVQVWPTAWSTEPDGLDDVWLISYEVTSTETELTARFTLLLNADLSVQIPGIDSVTLALLAGSSRTELAGEAVLSATHFALRFLQPNLRLTLQSDLFVPVAKVDDEWVDQGDRFEVDFSPGTVEIDSNGGLQFALDSAISLPHAARIGDTGIVVEISNVQFILSDAPSTVTPQIPNFRGVVFDEVTVHLPDAFAIPGLTPDRIVATGFSIGPGGSSGTISGQWDVAWSDTMPVGDGAGTLLGFAFGLESLSVSIVQNSVASCAISGRLALPFFDRVLDVSVSIGAGGDLALALRNAHDGLFTLSIEGLLTLEVRSLAFELEDGVASIVVGGSLQLHVGEPAVEWPEIELDGLRIRSDGRLELSGGWLDLAQPLALDLYAFSMEVSRIGFGTEEDGRRWIGLDAAVRLTELLPAGVSVEGLRVIWNPADPAEPPSLELQGVGIVFGIPGALAFEGKVALLDDEINGGKCFVGQLSLQLEALQLGIDAAIKIGRVPGPQPFTYVYVFLDVNVPIPLGPTGAAIYGMSGLFGLDVAPAATDDEWYDWFANQSPRFNATDPGKWAAAQGSTAFGLGLTVGTLFDGGWSVNTKGLVVLLLPGPVVLLVGRADLLKVPPGLDDSSAEGTFNLLAVVDGRAGYLQLNIDADWSLKKVIEISASAETYFDFARLDAWHVWLGQDTPSSRRIRANALKLFSADSFIMIDADGIAGGFAVNFGDDWRFGPVRITLRSWLEASGALSWRPPQIEGQIALGGEFGVAVAFFSLGIAAQAMLSAQAPAPYAVAGSLEVSVDVPKPLKDVEVSIELSWQEPATPFLQEPLDSVVLQHMKTTESWNLALQQTLSGAPGDDWVVVPPDARPLVSFARPVDDQTGIFALAPQGDLTDHLGDYALSYALTDVRLLRWRNEAWEEAPSSLNGTWAAILAPSGDVSGTSLQVGVRTPFAFTRFTSRALSDHSLALLSPWPCNDAEPPPEHCVDWNDFRPISDNPRPPFLEHHGVKLMTDGSLLVYEDIDDLFDLEFVLWLGTATTCFTWIAPPEAARTIRVEVARPDGWVFAQAWRQGVAVVTAARYGGPSWLEFEAEGIEWVSITWLGPGRVYVSRICWTTEEDAAAAVRREHWTTLAEDLAESFASDEEVLEPNTAYALEITTRAERRKGQSLDEAVEATHWAPFWTGGPPGLVPGRVGPAPHLSETEPPVYPHGGMLADLAPYVRWSIPSVGAAAAFRAHDVGLEFNETYVEQLYGGDLVIRLLDAHGAPVLPDFVQNAWGRAPTAELSTTEVAYLTAWEGCDSSNVVVVGLGQRKLASGGALLFDDFSSDSGAWQAVGAPADWHLGGGELLQTVAVGEPGAMYVSGDETWADVAIETVVRTGNGEVGVVFRYADASNYYSLRIGPESARLLRVSGGTTRELWGGPHGLGSGVSMRLAAMCDGYRLRCQLDDTLLCDLLDDDATAPLNGQAGLVAVDTAGAVFSEVLVRRWPGAILAPRRTWTAEMLGSFTTFASEFETRGTAGWSALELGTSTPSTIPHVVDDALIVHSAPGETVVAALAGDTASDDYTLEASVTCLGSNHVGLVVRYTSPDSYYLLRLTGDARRLQRRSAAGVTNIWEDTVGTDPGAEYAVAVSCVGDRITVTVDSVVICSVDDPAGPNAGSIGLMGGGQNGGAFRSVVVRSPRSIVYRWPFTTSAYAGFVELMDDFDGNVYDVEGSAVDAAEWADWAAPVAPVLTAANDALEAARSALAAAAPGDIPPLRQAAVAAAAARLEVTHAAWQGGLAAAGTGYRPRPPRVEISRLGTDAAPRALLLESPEPIDPERTTWTLERIAADGSRALVNNLVLAPSRDATSWLVWRSSGGPFTVGAYVLTGRYHLDIGAERPVLYRGGSSSIEVAELRFEVGPDVT